MDIKEFRLVFNGSIMDITIDPRFDEMRIRGMHEEMVVYDWVIREVYDGESP